MKNIRIGNGFDVHKLGSGRDLIIGGEKIPYKLGLLGHSDADVLIHAIIDSLLGAANSGDIGKLFPDNDPQYKNINSMELLELVHSKLCRDKFNIINIDTIIVCQEPRMSPYIEKMKENISSVLKNMDKDRISIKATTTEGLGFAGRGEGIAAYSVALLEKI